MPATAVYAIEASQVTKRFKRQRLRPNQTLKGFLLQSLRRKNGPKEDGWITALSDVSLKVKEGQMIGIIGSNGSGKSTFLKLLAGIGKPSGGNITVRGRVSALIELGAGFHPEISGRENVFINGIMLGLTHREVQEKFDSIVAFAELERFIDQPVKTYSSGMYMRLGFSVATHVDPQVLLIDEVLAVGDESFVHKCLERIQDFKHQGKTIVLVTHSLGLVERLCDKAYWIEKGTLQAEGWPRKVIDAYLQHVAAQEEKRYEALHERAQETLEQAPQAPAEVLTLQEIAEAPPGPGFERWGSREIEITRVRLLNREGSEQYVFQTGEELSIQIFFYAKKALKEIAFGIGLFTVDGQCVYGTNTDLDRWTLDVEPGSGEATFNIPRLDLLEGRYHLDIATHTVDGYPFDYQRRLHTLSFLSRQKEIGVYRPGHTWKFEGNVKAAVLPGDEE